MTSESPLTSKADHPTDATVAQQPGVSATGRPTRARTGAPTRSAPRRRPTGTPSGDQAVAGQAPSRPPRPAAVAPPTPRPEPFRTRRLDETPGPDRTAEVEKIRLAAGMIVGVHGIRGELKLQLWTDAPDHLRTIKEVWVGSERASRRMFSIRVNRDRALIRISGVTTPEIGRTFVGQRLFISGGDAQPLAEGEHFLFQLVGLTVVTEAGETVGTTVDVIETGANDVLVIKPEEGGPDILFPHHRDFVVGVDVEGGTMTVRPLDYLN